METKICSKCKIEKSVCEFSRKKSSNSELRSECKECNKISNKKYREENKEKELNRHKKYREENKETLKLKYKELHKEYRQNNKDYFKKYNKIYYENNLKKLIGYKIEYNKKKRHSDPFYNLICNVRGRVFHYLKLKNIDKDNKTFEIVGCSPEFLKEHIEKQFTEGMSWDLMGKYIHIDHKIPLSSAETKEEVYELCHYTNLQPLWAKDNLSKGSKIIL